MPFYTKAALFLAAFAAVRWALIGKRALWQALAHVAIGWINEEERIRRRLPRLQLPTEGLTRSRVSRDRQLQRLPIEDRAPVRLLA
jgi:hypothetical protein